MVESCGLTRDYCHRILRMFHSVSHGGQELQNLRPGGDNVVDEIAQAGVRLDRTE